MSCRLLLFFLFTTVLFSCKKEGPACIKSTGTNTVQIRTITSFNNIELSEDINLILQQDTIESITVSGGENLLNYVETSVEGTTLFIKNKNKCEWLRDYEKEKIDVIVHFKDLTKLTYTGSGDVTNTDTLHLNDFEILSQYASGSINLYVDADEFYSKVSDGTVDITIKGRSNLSYIYSAAVGRIDHSGLISPNAGVYNEGTGFVKIYANTHMNVQLYGSGNIYSYGNPSTITKDIRGKGKLINSN